MKKYTLFSIILIALMTLLVYMEENSVTTFSLLGVNITLPNAVWTAIFLGIFFIFSIIFFGVLNIKEYFYKKNIQKDIEILIANIKNRILYKEPLKKEVKILKNCNNFVNNIKGLQIEPKKCEKFEFLEDIEKLLNGEVIEISKYKLSEDNPWFIQNIKNRLKKDENFAKEVLKKYKNEELKKLAFKIYAKNASISEILKYDYEIDVDIIKAHIKDPDVKYLLEKAKLTPKEEIEIAKALHQTFDPDKEFEIVEPLKWASAYLAFKYEHIEKAKEIVEENELKFFEYFLKLREAGVKADIDEYIDSEI
ncbi:hypothetical protein NAMH_0048 [Nautilia profundicola AmH]|uniref:DUF1049 domain-containing protein n=1 Tax=Nautilia profundicola (strain ATCC BAA-1463 / DSM 18972 / AmH) TaxID=598659 RepID=B9L782_NAUPA|nr:hypothetical protein [Nautilia profundicola]ACM92856.1 hypothetical protein NAMH_0048 [Nautilia profundicola AmH]